MKGIDSNSSLALIQIREMEDAGREKKNESHEAHTHPNLND